MTGERSEGPVAEFRAALRRLQQGCGLDLTTLARQVKYSRSQLYAILDGQIHRPPEWDRLVEPLVAPEPIPLTLFTNHPAHLPAQLATVAGDPLAFTALTRLLRQRGLARVEPATLQLHRLLAVILRTPPHQRPDLPTLAVRLLRVAVPAEPWENPPAWPAWRQLPPTCPRRHRSPAQP